MGDTIKNHLFTSVQHSLCHAHLNTFMAKNWRELNVVAKFIESADRPDLTNRLLAIFPEAPEVTTPELWEKFSDLVNTVVPLPHDLSLTRDMIERARHTFQCRRYCRMWSASQVVLLDDEKEDLIEAREDVDQLENQVYYLQQEIKKAKRQKRHYETTVELLQQEVRRLQFILSKSKIPIEVKHSYGALYGHLFEAEEVPEISTFLRRLLDGEDTKEHMQNPQKKQKDKL